MKFLNMTLIFWERTSRKRNNYAVSKNEINMSLKECSEEEKFIQFAKV